MNEDSTTAAHREQACQQLSKVGRKLFKFVEYDKDENLMAEIRKHPMGLFIIAFVGVFIALAVLVASGLLAANLQNLGFDIDISNFRTAIFLVGVILSLLVLGVTAISLVLYVCNVIFVTNEKVAQVAYISLFNRQITQLGIGQVEDVTVQQRGIFAHIFNYGTLIIETAGEKENGNFTLVPNPNKFSQIIINAHEKNVQLYGN